MKFTVQFTSGRRSYAIKHGHMDTGMRGVRKIRAHLGVNLQLERISPSVRHESTDPEIEILEGLAHASRHFEETNTAVVNVPEAGLNQFCDRIVKVEKNEYTGEIKSASLVCSLNEDELLESWAGAGYPLEWNPSETRHHVLD